MKQVLNWITGEDIKNDFLTRRISYYAAKHQIQNRHSTIVIIGILLIALTIGVISG